MTKHGNIASIKKVIKEWGSTTSCELQLENSPCLNSLGSGNVCELVEDFNKDGVGTVIYDRHGEEIDWHDYVYEELSEDLIAEIFNIMEIYEADMLRTEKRCGS
jgi:hypothetical protein